MTTATLPPRDQLALLESIHVHPLPKRLEQMAIGVALGYSADELAALCGVARPTVFRHIDMLGERIFTGSVLDHNRSLIASWALLHRTCCLDEGFTDAHAGTLY